MIPSLTKTEPPSRPSRLRRGIKLALGAVLVPLGVVGLFLPVLQGVLFLVVGLLLLSDEIPMLARLREALRRRHPRPFEEAERLSSWFHRRLGQKREPGPRPRDQES